MSTSAALMSALSASMPCRDLRFTQAASPGARVWVSKTDPVVPAHTLSCILIANNLLIIVQIGCSSELKRVRDGKEKVRRIFDAMVAAERETHACVGKQN